jgi:hypothetical protein
MRLIANKRFQLILDGIGKVKRWIEKDEEFETETPAQGIACLMTKTARQVPTTVAEAERPRRRYRRRDMQAESE